MVGDQGVSVTELFGRELILFEFGFASQQRFTSGRIIHGIRVLDPAQ
jgi:hypothetical protein